MNRKDNELLPAAIDRLVDDTTHQARHNAWRLASWRVRWYLKNGTWPACAQVIPINTTTRVPAPAGAQTNATVIKFPHYRHQFGTAKVRPWRGKHI